MFAIRDFPRAINATILVIEHQTSCLGVRFAIPVPRENGNAMDYAGRFIAINFYNPVDHGVGDRLEIAARHLLYRTIVPGFP